MENTKSRWLDLLRLTLYLRMDNLFPLPLFLLMCLVPMLVQFAIATSHVLSLHLLILDLIQLVYLLWLHLLVLPVFATSQSCC